MRMRAPPFCKIGTPDSGIGLVTGRWPRASMRWPKSNGMKQRYRGGDSAPLSQRASAEASLARIVRSAWRRTRSTPRTRNGSSAHSFLSLPNSRSTEARPAVERLPPLRLARDQSVESVGRDPRRGGLALAGRAAPLGRTARGIGPGERPLTVLAGRRAMIAALDGRVVAHVERRGLGGEASRARRIEQRGNVVRLTVSPVLPLSVGTSASRRARCWCR
jgi:hypothetical protein